MSKVLELSAVQSAIANAGASWQAGVTSVSELSEEQKRLMLGYTPGPNEPTLEEQVSIGKAAFAAYQEASSAMRGAFGAPTSIDWRSNGGNFVTPVKNQGGCGSCVAFGSVAAIESQLKIQRGVNYEADLSEAHLFYCIARSEGRLCGNGWWPQNAMEAFKNVGVTIDACYPYSAGDQNCTGRRADWASFLTKITGYSKLNTIADIENYVSTKGPVEACFTVYQDFYNYTSGIYKHATGSVVGGHCVCIVGYNAVQKYWICKNSWNTTFGMGGFFNIAYGDCGIEGQVYGADAVVNNYNLSGVKITGLWADSNNRNAWVFVANYGWRKISNINDNSFINLLTQLASAKVTGTNTNITIENGMISIVYVF